jgi:hypothetical protein
MFSSIKGPGGTKTVHSGPVYTDSLTNLHSPAWWTDIRTSEDVTVQLTSKWQSFEWTQKAGYHPFPFPFPSWMAKDIDLQITVTCLSGSNMTVWLGFHELGFNKKDRLVFVDDRIFFHWNGYTADPSKLKAGTLHYVVPTVSTILEDLHRDLMCVHSLTQAISDPEADY